MQVVQNTGDLKRETWDFWLDWRWGKPEALYLDSYLFAARASKRHGWKWQNWWSRLDNRNAPMQIRPEPPAEVVERVKAQLCEAIMNCEVK